MVRWSYDLHGRIVEKRQETGGLVLITGYGYDAFGRLSKMTYPSGAVVNLAYVNGRIAGLTLNGQPLAGDVRHVPPAGTISNFAGAAHPFSRQIRSDTDSGNVIILN